MESTQQQHTVLHRARISRGTESDSSCYRRRTLTTHKDPAFSLPCFVWWTRSTRFFPRRNKVLKLIAIAFETMLYFAFVHNGQLNLVHLFLSFSGNTHGGWVGVLFFVSAAILNATNGTQHHNREEKERNRFKRPSYDFYG